MGDGAAARCFAPASLGLKKKEREVKQRAVNLIVELYKARKKKIVETRWTDK